MGIVVEAIINAVLLSSMYILVALGFALVLNIMGIFNFAHGALYMVGGYVCYQFAMVYGLNQWVSLFLTAVVLGLFGLFLERFAFRPIFGDMDRTIIMSVALILILETTINLTAGVHIRALPALVPGILRVRPISVSAERLVTSFIGIVLLMGLTLFIRKTRTGQQMLAVSEDPEGATLQGIRIHRLSAIAVAIGCALAAMAGSLMGTIFDLNTFMGDFMLIKIIQVVILSGIGSIGGVFAGGLIIGTLDSVMPLFTSPAITQTAGLGIIIIVLLLRPQGLFGRAVE